MKKKTHFNWEEFGIELGCIFFVVIIMIGIILAISTLLSLDEEWSRESARNIERCTDLCESKGLDYTRWNYSPILNTTDDSKDLICECKEKQHIYAWEEK